MSADNWAACPKCKAKVTLREDYEFYMMEDGKFSADYTAACRDCGWKWAFHYNVEALKP